MSDHAKLKFSSLRQESQSSSRYTCTRSCIISSVMCLHYFCSVGGSLPIITSYNSELIRNKYRGPYLGMTSVFWMLGSLQCAGLAWLIIPSDISFPLGTLQVRTDLCTVLRSSYCRLHSIRSCPSASCVSEQLAVAVLHLTKSNVRIKMPNSGQNLTHFPTNFQNVRTIFQMLLRALGFSPKSGRAVF